MAPRPSLFQDTPTLAAVDLSSVAADLSSVAADVLDTARVVVVDDEPANVELLGQILRSVGVPEVHGVTDAGQAVPRCLEVDADLLLLDLRMPGWTASP